MRACLPDAQAPPERPNDWTHRLSGYYVRQLGDPHPNPQAKGKKRMKMMGKVNVPQEAFLAVINVKKGDNN